MKILKACVAILLFLVSVGGSEPAQVGKRAPSIETISIYGDSIQLKSLEGSIVLVDFWSSWNIPSRKHNLTTRKLYEKYRAQSLRKKRKFVVIQVSLDMRSDLLQTAISKDNLYWRSHICDYKGWKSPLVSAFNVHKLPANFLLDTSGVIIAKDIWNEALDEALKTQMQ